MDRLRVFLCIASVVVSVSALSDPFTMGENAKDALTLPQIPGNFRIEVKAIGFETSGKSAKGTFSADDCDPGFGKSKACDPKFAAVADFEDPNNSAGDSIDYKYYEKIFEGTDIDRMDNINKVLSWDVCNKKPRRINLRFRLEDKDTFSDDKIDNFNYFLTGDRDRPAASEADAQWSAPITVKGHVWPKLHWVSFQYRMYSIIGQCKERPTSLWTKLKNG